MTSSSQRRASGPAERASAAGDQPSQGSASSSDSGKKAGRKLMPREQRRAEVLQAARRSFMAQGYGGASMRTIAKEAGINEAMLYRICPTKQALFEDAVAAPLEDAVNQTVAMAEAAATQNPGTEEMRQQTRGFVDGMLGAMSEIAPLLMAALMTDQETGSHFYRQRFEPALKRIVQVVHNNLRFWPHRNFDEEVVVHAVFGMCWMFAIESRFKPEEKRADLGEKLVQLIFDGIGTE